MYIIQIMFSINRYQFFKPNSYSILSVIYSAIDKQEVAAGDGAFLTLKILPFPYYPPLSNTKSSTNFPLEYIAYALTPVGL